MSILNTPVSSVGTFALGLVGAAGGGWAAYKPGNGGAYEFSAFSALPGAGVGAVAVPATFHLAKPALVAIGAQGIRAASFHLPALLGRGTLVAAE